MSMLDLEPVRPEKRTLLPYQTQCKKCGQVDKKITYYCTGVSILDFKYDYLHKVGLYAKVKPSRYTEIIKEHLVHECKCGYTWISDVLEESR